MNTRICNTCRGTGEISCHNWQSGGRRTEPCWACSPGPAYAPLTAAEVKALTAMAFGAPCTDDILEWLPRVLDQYEHVRSTNTRPVDPASLSVVRFNPYTGAPRSEADMLSDPAGLLIVPAGAPLKAAPRSEPEEPERAVYYAVKPNSASDTVLLSEQDYNSITQAGFRMWSSLRLEEVTLKHGRDIDYWHKLAVHRHKESQKALFLVDEALGCFTAAEHEGLQTALDDRDGERLAGLFQRRLSYVVPTLHRAKELL